MPKELECSYNSFMKARGFISWPDFLTEVQATPSFSVLRATGCEVFAGRTSFGMLSC